MLSRVSLVKFTKEFKKTGLQFDVVDWALCMLFMAENIQTIPVPILP